jgi:hypothetical protein
MFLFILLVHCFMFKIDIWIYLYDKLFIYMNFCVSFFCYCTEKKEADGLKDEIDPSLSENISI